MCKRLLILLFVLGFVGSASASVITAGLLHEWRFEDDLLDTSPSGGNHGTKMGAGAADYQAHPTGLDGLTAGSGAGSKCIFLDGVDDAILKTGANLPCWKDPLIPYNGLYDRPDDWSMNFLQKSIKANNVNYTAMAGWGTYKAGEARWITDKGKYYLSTYGADVATTGVIEPNWQMVTVTSDHLAANPSKSLITIYVDGVIVGTGTKNLLSRDSNINIEVGHYNKYSQGSYHWEGYLDEFCIWDHVLNQTEIDTLYADLIVPEPATIALLGLGGLALLRRRR